MLKKLFMACVLAAGGLLPGATAALDLRQQRELFLETETLLARRQQAAAEANMELLRDYPLYAVLQYRRLQDALWLQDDIETFLQEFADSRYAELLREQWLRYLADNRQWALFLQHYRPSDDTALQCLWRQAQYETGAAVQALLAAVELWTDGRSQPKECDALFQALLNSPYLTEDLKWRRFELALQAKNTGVAIYTKRLLNALRQPAADFWLQVHQRPALIKEQSVWRKPYPELGAIFAHGVIRMAEDDLETALAIWDLRRQQFAVDREHEDRVEKTLGMALARRKDSRAYGRLSRISAPDATAREWTVRAALLEQNWQHVDAALQRLNAEEKPAPQWQYWLGRALQETGKAQQAAQVFKQLAQDRSFYGFLAADYAGQSYQFADRPVPASRGEIDALEARRAFRMVEEFRLLGRDSEAIKQWWYAVGQLDRQGKMLAAKLAQQWQWRNIAVFTLAKADYWDDLELRFPVLYRDEINRNAVRQGLEPAIMYGLVRQESVFDPYAHSSAGARGLMQIMPGTGQHIAAKLHERWGSAVNLFDPELNLKYGAFYYKQLLERFDGHVALAAAGYNAGPQRVARWRPDFRSVPADIWIETIPFKETRKYVSSVLTYSMIYQQRLGVGRFKLKDLLRDVLPG
jgi:soluble lytic murein transglycosylase